MNQIRIPHLWWSSLPSLHGDSFTTSTTLIISSLLVFVSLATALIHLPCLKSRKSSHLEPINHPAVNMNSNGNSSRGETVDVVLVGGGHAQVAVIKTFGTMQSLLANQGVRVTLITSHVQTPYSGMVPMYIAGHVTKDDLMLDWNRLCRWAKIRLIRATVCRITYNNTGGGGLIYCTDGRPPIRYDCLSIDIGSGAKPPPGGRSSSPQWSPREHTPRKVPPHPHAIHPPPSTTVTTGMVLPVKPIATFCDTFDRWLGHVQVRLQESSSQQNNSDPPLPKASPPYKLCIVGGGAGGVELALALHYRLESIWKQHYSTFSQNDSTEESSTSSSVVASRPEICIVTQGSTLLESHNARVQRIITRIVQERKIRVLYRTQVVDIEDVTNDDLDKSSRRPKQKRLIVRRPEKETSLEDEDHNQLSNDSTSSSADLAFDDCLWCGNSSAASWLSTDTPFPTTKDGHFIQVHDTYECIDHPGVFASGDCCSLERYPRPKAGVFAVRAGPYIADNLLNYLTCQPLKSHRPQVDYLSLISTGDKYAVASKGNWFWVEGKWIWNLKEWIDRSWLAQYTTDLPDWKDSSQSAMRFGTSPSFDIGNFVRTKKSRATLQALEVTDGMRCGGCGGKVGSSILSNVLEKIYQRQVHYAASHHHLSHPQRIVHEDVAIVPITSSAQRGGSSPAFLHTLDYFHEIISDPFVFGKMAAVHALSDIHAMGDATAETATILALTPFAVDEAMMESTLLHMLSGVSDILQNEGVQIVGGHTCEGPQMACGLSLQGFTSDSKHLFRKYGGKVGDKIVLTKPLGTGALFAADMRAQASGIHITEAVLHMTTSNIYASRAAVQMDGVHACTDVSGFGLIGHLLEMLLANDNQDGQDKIAATVEPKLVPFLSGALEASRLGIFSTLQYQNFRASHAISNANDASKKYPVEYPLLFDPQTCGGLIYFVDSEECDELLLLLQTEKASGTVIGDIVEYVQDPNSELCSPEASEVGIQPPLSETVGRIRILLDE